MHDSASKCEVVWGATAIAAAINRSVPATYRLLKAEELSGAKKVGGRWCFRPSTFLDAVAAA
jgi:hypothetical protein